MTARLPAALAGLLLLAVAPRAVAQTTVVTPQGATSLSLEGLGSRDPFAPAATATNPLTGLPGLTFGTGEAEVALNTTVGFSYLRPYWPSAGQRLRLAAPNGAVASLDPFGDLSQSFGFVPRLDLSADTRSFGVGASVQYIGLGGNVDRTVSLGGGTADLVASNTLSILNVTLVELRKPFAFADLTEHPIWERLGRSNDSYVASLGTRYVAIRQDYHASLRGDAALSTADATQTFNGLGLAAGLSGDHPMGQHWGLYTVNRWTLLLGQNNRKSTATGTDGGGPYSAAVNENKTTFFPAGELELGVRYLAPLNSQPAATGPGPMLSVRVGFTGQYFSDIGFLPAAPGTNSFGERALFLVGFTVLAGLEY